MKVVIGQTKSCYNDEQIFNDYPILIGWKDKGHYIHYNEGSNNYKYDDYDLYWRENSLIVDLTNDELFKLLQQLTNESELVIGYASKYDHEKYGLDFSIEIYDDYRE
jgi:hypothetical protein